MRINPNEIEKYSAGNSTEWFSLQNDMDVARVQFMYNSYDELDTFVCHQIEQVSQEGNKYNRWVDCKRNYDDPLDQCPFCEAGMPQKPVMILKLYDHADGKVKLWQRGKTFRGKIEALFNRYPNLSNMVFEIERHGVRGDKKTTYEIYPMPDVEPFDLSQVENPDLIGTTIMDKTPDEMQAYLDTGSFPPVEKDEESEAEPVTRRQPESRNSGMATRRGSAEPVTRRGSTARRGEAF